MTKCSESIIALPSRERRNGLVWGCLISPRRTGFPWWGASPATFHVLRVPEIPAMYAIVTIADRVNIRCTPMIDG